MGMWLGVTSGLSPLPLYGWRSGGLDLRFEPSVSQLIDPAGRGQVVPWSVGVGGISESAAISWNDGLGR